MDGIIRKIYSSITRDIGRKLIALFFALIIYAVVNEQQQDERTIADVPVGVEVPPGLVCVGPSEFRVSVLVKGPSRALAQVNPNDLRGLVKIRVQDFNDGQPYRVRLAPDSFRSFHGIRVAEVPASENGLMLNLQRLVVQSVRVQPMFSKEKSLSRDYERRDIRCIPAEVQVVGPDRVLRAMREICTEPIPLDESVVESFETHMKLEVPEGITASPDSVTVQVNIVKNYINRRFDSLPLLFLAQPGSGSRRDFELVNPNQRVSVTIYGQQSTTLALKPDDIKPYIDISKFTEPGIYTVPVSCYAPGDRLDVKDIIPDKIRVKITDKK